MYINEVGIKSPDLPQNKYERYFNVLIGMAFFSLFFGQVVTNIVFASFLLSLFVFRPKITWIKPFWWILAFAVWEYASDYLGPYNGTGMESGGIGYHALILLLPLCVNRINYNSLIWYVLAGASVAALLIWIQVVVGMNAANPPLRINWEGEAMSWAASRPAGFKYRPWETQFIFSLVALLILPWINWKKKSSWVLLACLGSGILLPQIRAVIIAFIIAFGVQVLFLKGTISRKSLIRGFVVVTLIGVILLAVMSYFHSGLFHNIATGNGRDKIFLASFEVLKQYPITGIGGGEFFQQQYQQAWLDLGIEGGNSSLHMGIGHAHNDYLMLLVHNGLPAIILWFGFVIHSFLFVLKYGSYKESIMFVSLVLMHHIAALSETYLDYSTTTYAIFLCYGVLLRGPVINYKNWLNQR